MAQAAHYRKHAVEAVFHGWLMRSHFHTRDPSNANTFFVPVYAAAALLQGNRDSVRTRDRARSLVLARWPENLRVCAPAHAPKGSLSFFSILKIRLITHDGMR